MTRIYTKEVTGCLQCPNFGGRDWWFPKGKEADPEDAFGGREFGGGCNETGWHIPYEVTNADGIADWCPLEKKGGLTWTHEQRPR